MTRRPEGRAGAAGPGEDGARPSRHEKKLLDFDDVLDLEGAAIRDRRAELRRRGRRDRTTCAVTGVAISGGGIRSASFALGALQALEACIGTEGKDFGIEGIDYLSTVSGGGYIGCSLTAATQKTDGRFPFAEEDGSFKDPPAVRHIRNYSNYLMPRGFLDAVTALGLIGRGLVANGLVVAPFLFFFVALTLLVRRDLERLHEPKLLFWDYLGLVESSSPVVAGWLAALGGFWVTLSLVVANIAFLALWVFVKSIAVSWSGRKLGGWIAQSSLYEAYRRWKPTHFVGRLAKAIVPADGSAELNGGLVLASKLLFFATMLAFWFELQPYLLRAMVELSARPAPTEAPGTPSAIVSGAFASAMPYIPSILAALGAVFAFFSRYFDRIVEATGDVATWTARLGRIGARAALWFAAIVVPLFLWYLYLVLAYLGLDNPEFFPMAPSFVCTLVEEYDVTPAGVFASCAFLVALLAAWFVNPNATSLHRLYRDRLSKAFLFEPDPVKRDDRDDLYAYEPELHAIDTRLCPYPIVNTALNVQGSRHANKRGRNADFFDFTPRAVGSEATGYIETGRLAAAEAAPDLGTAMAISGAAVASNMGAMTVRPLVFTLALLNLRLGFWMRNPKVVATAPPWYRLLLGWLVDRPIGLLLREMFSSIDENSSTIYLTDGGHLENLGVYALMKRKCKVLIAIDGEADRHMRFPSLLALERYARIDLGATTSLPWEPIRDHALRIDKAFDEAEKHGIRVPCEVGPHCAAAEVKFSRNEEETAVLFYVKASLSGDEDDYILDYKRRNPAFPHETTNDQFFTEEQLEVYRALGFHIVKGLLSGTEPFAVLAGEKETEDRARQRLLDKVRGAILGAPPVASETAYPSGGRLPR
jgi:hypothetical protein